MKKWLLGIVLAAGLQAAGEEARPAKAVVITSPAEISGHADRRRVFLAGSIEMGTAADWQAELVARLSDLEVVILNPRRKDWRKEWKPELSDPHFRQQVEWELAALESADVIVMVLAPGTQSPVSLLELGLHARSGKLIVLCPEGFWRKGNVDAVVARYAVESVGSMEELVRAARRRLVP